MATKKQEAAEAEVVDQAEVIDEKAELACIDEAALNVNFEGLIQRIMVINDRIADGVRAVEECAVDDETLAGMDYEDVKRLATDLNAKYTEAEKARKAFNGDYDTPKKAVAVAYNRAMEPLIELRDRYKAQQKATEEAVKAGHWAAISEAYADFMEGNGLSQLAEAVPLERFAEDKWWNSVAKSFSEKSAIDKAIKRATEIVADWNAVKSAPYHFPEQAQAKFFETLSLREVNENDARMWEEQQRVAAVNAELAENAAYCAPEYEPMPEEAYAPVDAYEPVPEIVAEAEQVVAGVAEAPETYVLCVDMTPSQYEALIAWFKASDVHGVPMRTGFNGWQQASAMVKAVCNG